MEAIKPLCHYQLVEDAQVKEAVNGPLFSTREEAVKYVKEEVQSLSLVDDQLLSFEVDGARIVDRPGMWEAEMDTQRRIPTRTTFKVTKKRTQAGPVLSVDSGPLGGGRTSAEAAVVGGTRHDATDKADERNVNAVAGPSTGPGTRSNKRVSAGQEARPDSNDGAPPRRSSAQSPSTAPAARSASHLPSPTISHASPKEEAPTFVLAPAPATIVARLDAINRPNQPSAGPSVSAGPAESSTDAKDRKRGSKVVDAVEAIVVGNSAGHGESSRRKKAKTAQEEQTTVSSAARRPSSSPEREASAQTSMVERLRRTVRRSSASESTMRRGNNEGESFAVYIHILASLHGGLTAEATLEPIPLDAPLLPLLDICAKYLYPDEGDFAFRAQGRPVPVGSTPRSLGLSDDDTIYGTDLVVDSSPSIFIFPPVMMDLHCTVRFPDQWTLLDVWPRPVKHRKKLPLQWHLSVDPNGGVAVIDDGLGRQERDEGDGKRVCLNYITRGPDVHAPFVTYVGDPKTLYSVFIDDEMTVILAKNEVMAYLKRTITELGLPHDLANIFLRGWSTTFWHYDYCLVRFVNQHLVSEVINIEVTPVEAPETEVVETRIFFLFDGIDEEGAANDRWAGARERAKRDIQWWRDALGVPSRERQQDKTVIQVIDCAADQVDRYNARGKRVG